MAAGDLPGFEVPEGGVLEVVQQSRPQAEPEPEPEPRAEPEPEPQAEPEVSSGDAADPDAIDLGKLFQRAAKTAPGTDEPGSGDAILSPEDANGTGSGFYVNPRALVTAAHVVEGCKALSLVDGSQLRVISKDSAMDLAVLESGAASQVWLHISADTAPRLGATVYALGYPYLGLLQQGLSVTGGNISALGGLDPSEERIMISAPVQPGNSGGPLITSQGDVLGVVVSRIDDMSIFDETGTLPQNMNFAVPPRPLVEFLQAAGVDFPTAPPQEVDIAKGLPDTMRDAVVPIFCY